MLADHHSEAWNPMGTTDKTHHEFRCPTCGTTEDVTVYEKGSSWGASWQQPSELTHFSVAWKNDEYREPQPVKATCKACGSEAVHT